MLGGQHNIRTKTQHVLAVLKKSHLGIFILKTDTFSNRTINYTRQSNKFFFIYIIMYATRLCYISIIFSHDQNM